MTFAGDYPVFFKSCRPLALAGLFLSCGIGRAEIVDPRNPEEGRALLKQYAAEWSHWPVLKIHQLENERAALLKNKARLPRYNPLKMHHSLGYHSSFSISSNDVATTESIRWDSKQIRHISAIAMVPAYNPQESNMESYGFPKHFKIEIRNADNGTVEKVVNWMDAEFPDPGLYPVYFSDININAKELRITICKGGKDSGNRFFALGEIYLFGGRENDPALDNLLFWHRRQLTPTDKFSQQPLWNIEYLDDQITGLGFQLSSQQEDRQDLLIMPEGKAAREVLPKEVKLVLKLKRKESVGRVDIWPAVVPGPQGLAGFGFPKEIKVELAAEKDFKGSREAKYFYGSRGRPPGFVYSVRSWPPKVHYLRITLGGLKRAMERRILGLGEIVVQDSRGRRLDFEILEADGVSATYTNQLPLLGDGFSGGRRILSEVAWVRGLAQLRPVNQRLARVEQELLTTRRTWQFQQKQLTIGGGGGMVLLLIGTLFFQRRKRKVMLMRQSRRIVRDLHDEVGSSLGGLSLMLQRLAKKQEAKVLREDLSELALVAREANASLREVVSTSDQMEVSLHELVTLLKERATRVLRGVELDFVERVPCPDMNVALSTKRHLIMFFKEAIHNCARHADALQMRILFEVKDDVFYLTSCDNGCGFDRAQDGNGWGLDNMKERAAELGGKVDIWSRQGEGTIVELSVPIEVLSRGPKQEYKTSN